MTNFQYEYGTPGGSLSHGAIGKFKNTAAVGASGERRTADLLRAIQNQRHPQKRFVVIHDVMLPSAKYTANIDHIVVAGNRVLIIDSKVWSPGFYFTFRGQTYVYHSAKTKNDFNKKIGRFEAADHQTIPMIVNVLDQWLREVGIGYSIFMKPALIVWPPEGKQEPSLRFYSPKGSTSVMKGSKAHARLSSYIPNEPPHQILLHRLLELRQA